MSAINHNAVIRVEIERIRAIPSIAKTSSATPFARDGATSAWIGQYIF
jgi:hypothetical protein